MHLTVKGPPSMAGWSVRRRLLPIVLLALLSSACTSGPPAASPAGTPAGSASLTVPASSEIIPTPAITPGPASADPSLSPSSAEPPSASLAAEGGDPVTGQLGSFTWGDGGSDSPWLPGARLTVGRAEPLTVSIADGVATSDWSARRVPGGTKDGSGAVAIGSGTTGPITFIAPGPGSWSVQVTVGFAGDLGTASYYWQLMVR
jgi:hypothetical protein